MAILLSIFITLSTAPLQAAHPNAKIIITDLLDDDIRALVHVLSDPQMRSSIKAIVISTGNTYLIESEIIEFIKNGFGDNSLLYQSFNP